jgi:predicted transposase/invertase (TIGR01784 family)
VTKKIQSHHDKFFKKMMADKRVATEFFETYLPESIRSSVDLDSLSFSKESYLDEDLKTHITDIVYHAKIEGQEGYLVILVEHQSTVDDHMPLRLLEYTTKVIRDHIGQKRGTAYPIVYPIVFYNGKTKYDKSLDIFEYFCNNKELAKKVLCKPFQLVNIAEIDDEAIRKNLWLGTMEFALKHVKAREILQVLDQFKAHLLRVERAGGIDYLILVFEYFLAKGEAEDASRVIEFIKETFSEEIGEKAMNIAEQLKAKGESAMLMRLLKKRFKNIPDTYVKRIEAADAKKLLEWSDHLFEAEKIEDVFNPH